MTNWASSQMSNVKILQSAAQQHILQFHVTMDNAKRMHVAHACHMIPLGTNSTKPIFLGAVCMRFELGSI